MERPGVAALVVVLVVAMAFVPGSMATTYVVGGPLFWQIPQYNDPNFYQAWVNSNFPYRTTDTLEFRWRQGDSVMVVNQADFSTCNSMHPLTAWYDNLVLSLPLTAFRNRVYFISGAPGHCAGGQKFYIDVFA